MDHTQCHPRVQEEEVPTVEVVGRNKEDEELMWEDTICTRQTTSLANKDINTNINGINKKQISSQIATPSVVEGCDIRGETMCEEDLLVGITEEGGGGDIVYDDRADGNLDVRPCVGAEQVMEVKGISSNDVRTNEVSERVPCDFSKQGVCRIHKTKGNKMSRKTKVWRKKRYGYGWVTITQSSHTCRMSDFDQQKSEVGIRAAKPNLSSKE